MNKRILFILLSIVLSLSLMVGCKKQEIKENNNPSNLELNTNQGVIEDKELEVFTFTNTSLIWNGNGTDLETKITNTSDNDEYLKGFNVIVYDEDGNVIASMEGYVGTTIKAHDTKVMSTGHYKDLTKATRIEYEIIR